MSRIDKTEDLEGTKMKITDAGIQSSSTHKLETSREVSERYEIFSGQNTADEPAYVLDIGSSSAVTTQKTYLNCDQEITGDEETNVKLKLIEDFIYQLTGKRMRLRSPSLETGPGDKAPSAASNMAVRERDGWGLVYEYKEVTKELESIKFSASGTVTTADGRTVEFNVQFLMSREYIREHYLSVGQSAAEKVDPLVLVFGQGAPILSRIKQTFDLDSDGKADEISFAAENSGFLALDKNGDGKITSGKELFGPSTGNGFSELRAYDIDANGWIDESDEVFGRLSVLTMSKDGKRMSFKLGELGIGAIYLNDTATPYAIKDEAGEYGDMRSSSVFLKEDGTAGTIHHIDLVI